MADITIAITLDTAAPPFDVSATLDGIEYTLRVEYNARDIAWFLTILDVDDAVLVASQPMIEGWPLLSRHKPTFAGMPQGDLYLQGDTFVYRGAV